MKVRKVIILFALTALVGGAVLADGGEPGDWELGLFTGFAFLDDYEGGGVRSHPERRTNRRKTS